ncbi:MAG: hypothetical protein DHS20C17_21710 [Cyclobacteriaceae bacterium]|nr:MAG: hypothetical protein DHS20C17_21710 [Cyclobacteriaceae bacterium]
MKRDNLKFTKLHKQITFNIQSFVGKLRFATCLFLVMFLVTAPCRASYIGTQKVGLNDSIEVQIDMLPAKNHFLIRGEINGKRAYFLLDTGASYTVLHRKSAKYYNFQLFPLKTKHNGTIGVNPSTRVERSAAINVLLDFGQSTFKQSYTAQDLTPVVDHVYKISKIRIAGIIGSDFLKRYACSVDLGNKMLVIR